MAALFFCLLAESYGALSNLLSYEGEVVAVCLRRLPMSFYRQCILVKGVTVQVAWIPEEFAKVRTYVRLVDDDGWQVKEVGGRRSEEYVQAHERDHMGHRSRTDA
jgi:hypothetical protein